MKYFNIHTHSLISDPEVIGIYSADIRAIKSVEQFSKPFSIGIHPWYISESDFQQQLVLFQSTLKDPFCVAIGESGLDKCISVPLYIQQEVFSQMIDYSEQIRIPLIIHCVRAFSELLQFKKKRKPTQPWIIHGFRGNPLLAEQLTNAGLYLSLGSKFHPETAALLPLEQLFLETDETNIQIQTVYQQVAQIRKMSVEALSRQIMLQAKQIFPHILFEHV